MNIYVILIFTFTFIAVFSVIYSLGAKERKKEKNFSYLAIPEFEDENIEEKSTDDFLGKLYEDKYRKKFLQADVRITFAEFKVYFYYLVFSVILVFIVSSIFVSVFFGIMIAVALIVLLYLLPDILVDNKKSKRAVALNAQKNDILSIMSSCSQTNMPLDKTFKTLSTRLEYPASVIFDEAYQMLAVGSNPADVLEHLRLIFDSNDFNFLLSSYQLWLENQGSLTDTYNLAAIAIRDKEEIDLNMKGLISHAKTGMIIVVVLSLFFVLLSLFSIPDIFIAFIKKLVGQISVVISVFIIGGAIAAINKIKNSVKY